MNGWKLVYTTYKPQQEALREALCTVGNGYFATRGAAPEPVANDIHYPGTYIAGCYNRLPTALAGVTVENYTRVNASHFAVLRLPYQTADSIYQRRQYVHR